MAKYRDIDSSVRIGGDLQIPTGSIVAGAIKINEVNGQITATTFVGGGAGLTNLSSAAMPDVLTLNGSRSMTGGLIIPIEGEVLNMGVANKDAHIRFGGNNAYFQIKFTGGTETGNNNSFELWTAGFTGSSGAMIKSIRVQQDGDLRVLKNLLVSGTTSLTGALTAATIRGTTINATANLQEAGTNLSAKYEPKGTLHDDRYYTETEMDTKLAGKSDTTHTHTFASLTSKPTTISGYGITDAYTKTNMQTSGQAALHWGNLTNVPATFAPSTHTHHDLYYTETEMDTKLSGKSDTSHTHTFASLTSKPTTISAYGITDAYTKTNMQTSGGASLHWNNLTNKPTTFAPSTHTHDDRYYTETEIDAKLATKFDKAGGAITGPVKVYADAQDKKNTIRIGDRDGSHGFTLQYDGLGEGNENKLELYTDNVEAGELSIKSYEIKQDGIINAVQGLRVNGQNVWHAGNFNPSTKSDTGHTHTFASLTSKPTTVSGFGITDAYTKTNLQTSGGATVHWGNLTGLPSTFAPSAHTHDDRYYTESEMDTKLASKSDTSHTHTFAALTSKPTTISGYGITDAYTKSNMQTSGGASLHWSNLTNVPTTFAPSTHSHDNLYYTETEMDAKLNTKFDKAGGTITGPVKIYSSGENQDNTIRIGDRDTRDGFTLKYLGTGDGNDNSLELYTDQVVTGGLSLKSYEIKQDGILNAIQGLRVNGQNVWHAGNFNPSTKSDTTHTHTFASLTSKPTTISTYGITDAYTKTNMQTSGGASVHWSNLTNKPSTFEPSAHTHDDRYYTETEMNTKLSGKSDTTHTHTFAALTSKPTTLSGYGITDAAAKVHDHDDVYYTETEIDTKLDGVNADITTINTALTGKSDTGHTHTFTSLTSRPTTISGYGITDAYTKTNMQTSGQAVLHWGNLTGVPATFTPSTHNHDTLYYTETEIDTMLETKSNAGHVHGWAEITGKPTTFAPSTHSHSISQVTSLQSELDAKLDKTANAVSSSKWATARTITLGEDATGSVSLDGSANVTLNVAVKDNSHNHTLANVTGLETALNGKAALQHSHGASDLPVLDEITHRTITGTTNATAYVAFAQAPTNPSHYSAHFKITVTSTANASIGHTLYLWVQGNGETLPHITAMSEQKSTTAATTGLYNIRVVYPKAANNGQRAFVELSANNTTVRNITVELLESKNIDLLPSLTATTYSSTNHNNTVRTVNFDGVATNGAFYGSFSGNASSSTYASNLYNANFKAGEALVANDMVFLGAGNTWLKATTVGTQIPIGAMIGRSTAAEPVGDTGAIYLQGYGSLLANLPGARIVGKDLFIRGTISENNLVTDGHITTELEPGYSYLRVGSCVNTANNINYDGNNRIYTVTTGGLLQAVDGRKIDADTVDGKHASEFALSGHLHDDRYYTETEADNRFEPKGKLHDDRYYTEAEIDTKLAGKSDVHSHPYDNYQNWKLKVNGEATGETIGTLGSVNLTGAGAVTVSRTANTITITGANDNTWRPIETTPTTSTANSISSSWAKTHQEKMGNGGHVPAAGTAGQFLAHNGVWATPTNNYVSSVSSTDGGNGTLTLNRSGLSALTLSLAHNHDNAYLGKTAKAVDSDKLDGLDSTDFERQLKSNEVTIDAAGWYTIAKNGNPPSVSGGDRATGYFVITDNLSSRHQSVHFIASTNYGSNSNSQISVLNNGTYSASVPFTKIRIITGGMYSGAKLQIYIPTTSKARTFLYFNDQSSGWQLINWTLENTIDSGYVAQELDLTDRDFIVGRSNSDKVEIKRTGIVNATGGYQWNGQSLDNRYALASHTHAISNVTNLQSELNGKLSLTGGTMTGNINFTQDQQGITWVRNTDGASIKFYNESNTDPNSRLEFCLIDDHSPFFRWTSGYLQEDPIELMRLVPVAGNLTVKGSVTAASFSGNATSASKLATARNIALTGGVTGNANFDGSGNLSITTTVTNNSHSHTIANVTGLESALNAKAPNSALDLKAPYQKINASIKGATWSRILHLTNGGVTGHSVILNIAGTRGNVVYNATFLITTAHGGPAGNIMQIGNSSYSTFKIRTVIDDRGDGYIEIYDDANGIPNTDLQSIQVSYLNLKNTTVTALTTFTDGTTIPANFFARGEIQTVNGATFVGNLVGSVTGNVTGNASSASKWATARTLTLNGAITGNVSMDGSGNVTLATTVNHEHSRLSIPDNRSVADAPNSFPKSLSASFKSNTVVGSPPVSTGSSYAHILTMNGWTGGNDGGGGHTSQLAFGDGLAIRLSTSTTEWGTWRKVWHDGNFNPSNYLGTGASQTVGNNFTVNGKLNIGNINNTHGDLVVYGVSGLPRIHLDGNASGIESSTNTNIYLNGDGHATFKATVSINTLKVTSRGLVENLNAHYLNGIQEVSFTKNVTTVDNTGYGIVKGLEAIAYGGELHVDPGVAYTASGMRVEIPARAKVNMTPASTSANRYDVVYIKGPSTSTQEGTFGYVEGGATKAAALAHASLKDAVVLAVILRAVNQASIVLSDIDNAVRDLDKTIGTKPFFVDESTKDVKARYEVHAKKFKQDGQYLDYYYATLNVANTFNGNQKINGRVHINAASSLGGTATSGNYGLRVGTDSAYIAMDGNEILSTSDLNIRALAGNTLISGSTGIVLESKVRAPQSARTITIAKGQRSTTWTHNYGAATYVVVLSPNSFARHVKWSSKVANSVVIEIDDTYDQDILVDCLLIGY